jgi:hypothetical protein
MEGVAADHPNTPSDLRHLPCRRQNPRHHAIANGWNSSGAILAVFMGAIGLH